MTTPTVDPERINRLLDWLESSLKGAQDFTLEQAPLVAREIVAWQFAYSLLLTIVFAAVTLAAIIASIGMFKWSKRLYTESHNERSRGGYCHDDRWVGPVIAGGFLVAAACGLFVGVPYNATSALKAKTAPRLVIIDYIRGKS